MRSDAVVRGVLDLVQWKCHDIGKVRENIQSHDDRTSDKQCARQIPLWIFDFAPPVNVTLFHADCAKSGPVIARPNTSQKANTPAVAAAGCTASRRQPFADGFHQSELNAAPPAFQPTNSPRTTRPKSAAAFVKVNEFWISLAELQSASVDESKQQDQKDRDELLCREAECVATDDHRRDQKARAGDRRQDDA
jgi:hypothetical protein